MALYKDNFPYVDGAHDIALRMNTTYSFQELSDILDIPMFGKILACHTKGQLFILDEERTDNGLERLNLTEKTDFVAGRLELSLSFIKDQRLVQDVTLSFSRDPDTKRWTLKTYGFTIQNARRQLPYSNKPAFQEIGRFILNHHHKTRSKTKHPIKRIR